MSDNLIYEKVIYEDATKGIQLRLVVSTFKDVDYLHLRKYYMSYDEGFVPTKEGASMPLNINGVFALLDGMIEICSIAESEDSILEHFQAKLDELKQRNEQISRISESSGQTVLLG